MSPDVTTGTQKAVAGVGFAAVVGALLAVGLVLREHGPGNMGNGMLVGAGIGLVGVVVVLARLVLRPDRTTTFERAWTQTGDERDDAVLTRALAVLGLLSLPLTGATAVAVALGVEPEMALALLLFSLIGILAAAFTLIHRRS